MRCPNCYNELPVDTTACPSCLFTVAEHLHKPGQDVFSNLATVTAARPGVESGPQVESAAEPAQEHGTQYSATPTNNGSSKPLPSRPLSTKPLHPVKRGSTKPLPKQGFKASALRRMQAASDSSKGQTLAKIVLPIVIIGAVGAYLYLFTDLFRPQIGPKRAMTSLNEFRRLESNRPGMTVDQLADDVLDQSQKAGNLASYMGWLVKPIPGERSKAIVIFAFSEKDGQERSAEWMGDLSSGVFTPRTDLAKEIYSGPNPGKQGRK
jgi:hypothetical protein